MALRATPWRVYAQPLQPSPRSCKRRLRGFPLVRHGCAPQQSQPLGAGAGASGRAGAPWPHRTAPAPTPNAALPPRRVFSTHPLLCVGGPRAAVLRPVPRRVPRGQASPHRARVCGRAEVGAAAPMCSGAEPVKAASRRCAAVTSCPALTEPAPPHGQAIIAAWSCRAVLTPAPQRE